MDNIYQRYPDFDDDTITVPRYLFNMMTEFSIALTDTNTHHTPYTLTQIIVNDLFDEDNEEFDVSSSQ